MDVHAKTEVLMKRSLRFSTLLLLGLACLAGPAAAQTAAQAATQAPAPAKPVDMKKLIVEIAGDYSFDLQGTTLVVQFVEQDGKLFGAPPGEALEEIRPIEGKPMFFDVTVNGDQYYVLQFVRNDKGVIDKCLLTVQDQIVEGLKIIKSRA
jgi:hypothetical protein